MVPVVTHEPVINVHPGSAHLHQARGGARLLKHGAVPSPRSRPMLYSEFFITSGCPLTNPYEPIQILLGNANQIIVFKPHEHVLPFVLP